MRRRPPKQGELRTDVSKATMFQGVDSVLRPRFKALSKKISAKFSGNTSRTRFFAQNGGEKALNRCDVWVLQRKELKRTSKEEPYSLRTVGYGWVGICGVGCGNWRRLRTVKWLVRIGGVLVAKKALFSARAKPPEKEKLFLSTAKLQLSTTPKLTYSYKFHPQKTTVSLQQNNPFSKLRNLASALQSPFRTDSKPFRRRFAGKTGFGTSRRKFLLKSFSAEL